MLQAYVNGGHPPVTFAIALPLLKPLQLTFEGNASTSAVNVLMKMVSVSLAGGQLRLFVVVRINVANPFIISDDDGVYVAFSAVLEGLKVPVPPDHIPVVTPVTDPFKLAVGLLAQTIILGPALAVMAAVNEVTVTVAVVAGHPDVS